MDFSKYENKLPWPSKNSGNPSLKKAYDTEQNRLEDLFKTDALAEVGLSAHPRADRIFSKAWALGHASGLPEVFVYLEDLAELFVDDLNAQKNIHYTMA